LYHKVLPVNATTVALTFLLAILAVFYGLGHGRRRGDVRRSHAGVQLFLSASDWNVRVADPENWVALLAFLVVAVISSHLSTRARQKAADASARQHDVESYMRSARDCLNPAT